MEDSAFYGQTVTGCILLLGGNKQSLPYKSEKTLNVFGPFPEEKKKLISFKELSDWIFAVRNLALFLLF